MKLASKMFALTALAVACSAASAQQSAPLTVTGNITPPGCTASIGNGGTFDYSAIVASTLSNNADGTRLPDAPLTTFNISCLGAAQVAWTIKDNQPGTTYWTADAQNMGLGKDTAGNKIGTYTVRLSSPVLDGANAWVMYTTNSGVNWTSQNRSGYMMRPDQQYSYSKTGNANTVDKGSVFSGDMQVYTYIAPKNKLDTTGAIDLQGSSTINLTYL
jgi:hypothetical protein